jgi:glycosyltransferase involved in cell wall biosynthesis
MSLVFTIVTPSLNQSLFIEQTIKSVLDQDYRLREYIIIDGGSTDGTLDIISRYQPSLTFSETGQDTGQSNAIARGFKRGTGDILGWLNSDDYYLPGTLAKVAHIFEKHPDIVLVYGDYIVLRPSGEQIYKPKVSWNHTIALYAYLMIPQPSAFWRRSAYDSIGGLNDNYDYCMDYDLFLRLSAAYPGKFLHLQEPLSVFRLHSDSKTARHHGVFSSENKLVRAQFNRWRRPLREAIKMACYLALQYKYLTERGQIRFRKESYT